MKRLSLGFVALALLALTAPDAPAQAVAYQPIPGTIAEGPSLSSTSVVSADRRYVRMTLNPQFIGVLNFETLSVPSGAVSGLNGNGGGGAGGLGGVGGANGPMIGIGPVAGLGPVGAATAPARPPIHINMMGPEDEARPRKAIRPRKSRSTAPKTQP